MRYAIALSTLTLTLISAPATMIAATPGSGAASDASASPAASSTASSQMYGPDYEHCSAKTTMGIAECVAERAKVWDGRLNTAYQALTQRSDPAQRAPLKKAQRAWISYRDANCKFYSAGQGTISRIEGAECLRAMTQQRTCEMERANNPEGKAGEGCTP